MGDMIEQRAQQGLAAMKRGDAAAARSAFEDVVQAGRAGAKLFLLLAEACGALNDRAEQNAALDKALALEPRNIAAMVMKGDRTIADGDDRAASAWYTRVLTIVSQGAATPDSAALAARAEAGLTVTRARFKNHLSLSIGGESPSERFEEAIAILTGASAPQLQAPTSFYYPGLPQIAFYDPQAFEWIARLEAAVPEIRGELEAILKTQDGFRPYVEADPTRPNKGHALLNDASWSAYHLYDRGAPDPVNAPRCPATMRALADVPMPHIAQRSPMALFSLLKPKTHIPPHNGMLNTRLIVHLPLIVPDGCRLRVGNHTRTVMAGQVMIFDDSIEHEAWNDSASTRVVLLFEIWRPELTSTERAALTRMFDAISTYGA